MKLSVPAFAKTNWFLEIQGKRSDSYHQLVTVLQTINLQDGIQFTALDSKEIELEVDGYPAGPVEDNLILKAARLLETYAPGRGVRIRLDKRIPSGAGLGGGSSDAAVTLLVLNKLWECGLSLSELESLALRLGSDVSFFLHGGTAAGWGRGEQIQALDDPFDEEPILICHPGFSLSTAEVYRDLDFHPLSPSESELTTADLEPKIRFFHKALVDKAWALLHNDLENPVLSRYPALGEMKQLLEDNGCARVMLCGSGSSLLGLGAVASLEKAARGWATLEAGECFLCTTLSRVRYWELLSDSAGLDLRVQ